MATLKFQGSDRPQVFVLRSSYISKEVQKVLLAGMSRCIERTFTLLEAIRDAKESQADCYYVVRSSQCLW